MTFATAVLGGLALGGCADGVEFNGKIFDALGVSNAAQQKSSGPTKVPERNGLVLPPDLAKLPEPGSGSAVQQQAMDPSFPVDQDEKKRMAQADLERQQAEFCKKNYETKKALGIATYDAKGPLGPCGANPVLTPIIKNALPQSSQ